MRNTVTQVKVGSYHVIRETAGRNLGQFRVVHTWSGAAIGTFPTFKGGADAARAATREEYLVRLYGKEGALSMIRANERRLV